MRIWILALSVAVVCGGCSMTPKSDGFQWKNPFSRKDKAPEPYPNPVKLAVTWTPDTLTTPGKTPTRGFGGRIFFYNDKSQPVPVEGDLTIVAYEETGRPDQPPKSRQFGFTKEQFTKHFSQSDLGASYSIWLPWDADGGNGQRITLVPSFRAEKGNQIQGSPTVVLLSGPMTPASASGMARYERPRESYVPQNAQTNSVRQAGYVPAGMQQGTEYLPQGQQQGNARGGMTTTTIPMSSGMSRRMANEKF
jgi:hypothetical protein